MSAQRILTRNIIEVEVEVEVEFFNKQICTFPKLSDIIPIQSQVRFLAGAPIVVALVKSQFHSSPGSVHSKKEKKKKKNQQNKKQKITGLQKA